MKTPSYPNKPLGSVRAVARAAGWRERDLRRLAERAPHLYPLATHGMERKANGDEKIFYNPVWPLKKLQKRINRRVLGRVAFPDFIAGVTGRGCREECTLHTSASTVIGLDIRTFFEAISAELVHEVWQHCLHFPPEVAKLLTRLTAHDGHLPRGAPTSSALANLVFWDVEGALVQHLARRGITYSRYVDNVTLSSRRTLTPAEVEGAIGDVQSMFARKGVLPNPDKQYVNWPTGPRRMHNINVSGLHPTLRRGVRREIRAAIHNLERDCEVQIPDEDLAKRTKSLHGKVAWWKQFHPNQASRPAAHLKALEASVNGTEGNTTA